jgi:hypothetical protein
VAERTIGIAGERAGYDEAGPVILRWTAPDALSNLVAVLELTAEGHLRCSAATRRPFASTVKLVEDVLVAGDYYDGGRYEPIAAFAWPMLLQTGGLSQLVGTRLELTSRGREALDWPSYETLGALWARWLKSVSYDELSRIDAIKGQRKQGTLTSVPKRRAAVAAALAVVVPGAWLDADELLGILRAQEPPLEVARNLLALWRLYLVDPYYGTLGHAARAAWDVLEGRYALCVLFEYAATMGVIDVAYTDPRGARDDYRDLWGADQHAWLSRYDGLVAIRVNELGDAILNDPDVLPDLALPVPRRLRPVD